MIEQWTRVESVDILLKGDTTTNREVVRRVTRQTLLKEKDANALRLFKSRPCDRQADDTEEIYR